MTLSSYSIGRFKVTHEDYAFYLKMAGLPAQQFDKEWRNKTLADMTHFKNSPAVVSWREADSYCRWLKGDGAAVFPADGSAVGVRGAWPGAVYSGGNG